ncbi:glycosyltransferase family 4 protein [Ramlibacter sp. PS4R-6]|uniref:glycosyltransferase family 4 protein n=1 Tax=Ramlibacter sp. PS4R-6 TaxID=3133438 RepID=UPI0030AD334F
MNVVLVNDSARIDGGVARVALSSAAVLAQRGHDVTLLAAGDDEAGDAQRGFRAVFTGQREIADDPNRLQAAVQGIWNARARRALHAILAPLDPADTVVHLHGWSHALSASVAAEAARMRFPAVATLHDYFAACPNGGFFNHRTLRHCPLEPMGARCMATHCDSRGYPHKVWRVVRQAVQLRSGFPACTRHFITVSRYSARILRPYLPAGAVVHAVRNPVEAERRAPADVGAHDTFLFVGRLSPEKGALLFARAAAGLGVPATIVGDGVLRAEVAHACPAARMTGWLASPAITAEMRRARALVLPSLWHETQGLVVAEAAAEGVPAIVPRESAAAEFVADGITGLHFTSGDEADLRAKMALLRTDAGLAARLGKAASGQFWSDPPTPGRHADHLEAVYRRVIGDAARRRAPP